MKITALRSIAKINRNVLQNSGRLFSFKFEMTAANRQSAEQQEEAKIAPEEAPKTTPAPASFRYNVCQPRTSPVEKPTMAGDMSSMQKQSVKAAIEEQQLQPSMLPEYFQKRMERSALVNPESDHTEEDKINRITHNQRKFQMSKTYTNAILPLKSVKLANPFPEPVKMMMSRTVSDDEKAEQMLAEARSQRQMSDFSSKNFRTFTTAARRWYSSSSNDEGAGKVVGANPEKCKKKQQKKAKGCPKMRLKGCPPPAPKTTCDRIPRDLNCKKQEAPYPAYSEFCHEDVIEKPSECKLCPWRPEDNPNFKPPKNKFHTSSMTSVRRSGLEMECLEDVEMESEAEPTMPEQSREGMQCDLRKPECERPKSRRCPHPKKEEKKKVEEVKKKKEKPKSECISRILEEGFPADRALPVLSLTTKKSEKGKPKDPHGSCKIKKFKFPECSKKVKKDKQEEVDDKCPKKRKIKIKDCPPEDEKKCSSLEGIMGYRLSSEDGNKIQKDKKKCPKIDLTVFKEEKEEDDPCGLKKKGTTKICPADLLRKKRRHPKKKTSGIITPVDSKTDMPQPRRTI